ncbi:MAG: hypothetical protein WDN72_07645 [Alphaproteobacteria bacterium]
MPQAAAKAPTTPQLAISAGIEERLAKGELSQKQVEDFRRFLDRVNAELLSHRIIRENPYSRWFARGEASDAELRHFIQQFSVFSNLFLVAQLLKVINAPSLEQMRAGKEILMNELGVIYRKPRNDNVPQAGAEKSEAKKDAEGDPALVSIEGSVEGSTYKHRAAHYEWMLGVGEPLGLGYGDLGKRRHGTTTTLHFCDELNRTYGSEDPMIAEGASFAVENWAAAGFWQDLEDGLVKLKQDRIPGLKLAFFTWHNRVEGQHAAHVMDELEEAYFDPHFDEAKFFKGGHEILDAVATFWDGLEDDRLKKRTKA